MGIKQIVQEIFNQRQREIRDVFFVACGGSLADMYPAKYFLDSEAKTVHAGLCTANEFVYATPKSLGEHSVTILCSHSGNTPETIRASRRAKSLGSSTLFLTHNENAVLANDCDYCIRYDWGDETNVVNNPMAMMLGIAAEILYAAEGYMHYDMFMDGLDKVNAIANEAKSLAAVRAEKFASDYCNEKLIYVLSSGASFGIAYSFAMCSLMEMQWMHACAIHSGEYFHGPFEVTDEKTPYILLINEGPTRALDERALGFLKRYANKFMVVDARETRINEINRSVVEYFNPIVFYSMLCVYRSKLAKRRDHALDTRRYMGKTEY